MSEALLSKVGQGQTESLSLTDLRGNPRRNRIEETVRVVLFGAAAFSVVVSLAIVTVLVVKAVGFLGGVDWSTLVSDKGWFPRVGRFDLVTLFAGSLYVTVIALIVSTPLGVGTAVFLSEYASPRTRRLLKPTVEVLAGLPSVVVAFFVIRTINPDVLRVLVPSAGFANLAAAGIGVGILTIPIIASVTEDALAAVPGALREASSGLGAKKITTSVRVVLPAAVSGIVAALIVGASRALGETMLVTLAAGGAGGAPRTFNPFHPGLSMTSGMANLAVGTDNVAGAANSVDSLYLVGLLLFFFTLALNLVGNRFVRRFREVY